MTDETPETPTASEAETEKPSGPQMAVLAQFLRDLSFENPTPISSLQLEKNPTVNVDVDVQGRRITEDQYEVQLMIHVQALKPDSQDVAFVTECTYSGIFMIRNVPETHMEGFMVVECARLLFPYARNIVSDATRDGGFPPLMLDPIDFLKLYRRKQQEVAKAAEKAQAEAEGQTLN